MNKSNTTSSSRFYKKRINKAFHQVWHRVTVLENFWSISIGRYELIFNEKLPIVYANFRV